MPKRPYDSLRWRRLRKQKLNANPLCEYKLACTLARATEVDHVVPIEDGGDAFDWDNLKSTCKACHLLKTRYRDQLHRDAPVRVKGVDAKTGMPVDPGHWWNR
jgi:5-methylcytosine-specific restriction endonuclease McrA